MRQIVIFIPSVENGGVEKNFFYLIDYLSKKFNKIYVVTATKNLNKNNLNKNIQLIVPKSSNWNNKKRIYKYFICSYLLFKHFRKKKITIFSFQANTFAILISFLINSKIIIRLNTSLYKYINNFVKKKIYKLIYSFADIIIVNSVSFKKELKNKYQTLPYYFSLDQD